MYLVTSNKTEKDLVHDRDTMLLKTRLIQYLIQNHQILHSSDLISMKIQQ